MSNRLEFARISNMQSLCQELLFSLEIKKSMCQTVNIFQNRHKGEKPGHLSRYCVEFETRIMKYKSKTITTLINYILSHFIKT